LVQIALGTIKKNTETVIDISKEVSLEINVENTKYMLPSLRQNVGQNRDMKIASRLFENVAQFKCNDSNKSKFDSGEN
jgi:hypothetical protein